MFCATAEHLLNHSNQACIFQAVDIYSFGLLLWGIITGQQPCMHDESLRKPRQVSAPKLDCVNSRTCSMLMSLNGVLLSHIARLRVSYNSGYNGLQAWA